MMMPRVIYIIVVLTATLLASCSSTAPPLNNLISKDLTQPNDAAIVYIFRPYRYFGVLRSPDFTFNSTRIGEIENKRYLYFYAYPMELILGKVVDGQVEQLKIKIEAGKKYYLKFDMEEGYSQLSQQEGLKYLRELNMGGNFKPVIIGNKPSNSPMPISNQATNLESKQKDYLKYDDNTKIGVIKYGTDMENRNVVLGKIEEVCNTKNVALLTGKAKQNGASYKTLDETIESNIIEIKFQCLY
jgi:Protein of unknown function (DUF2846)